jgi:hypothetical protein
MRQTTLVGVLATAADLHQHPHTQPGLHYARSVLVLDAEAGEPLPPTGRGRPVAAREAGSLRLHRMDLCWGTDAAVRDRVLATDRPCVVAVVRGRNASKAAEALRQLEGAGREVHLLHASELGAWRIVGSDAGRTQVQTSTATGWQVVASVPHTIPQPEPEPEPSPAPAPAPAQEEADAQAGD